jgi:nicotinamide-nucleotide amidase
MIDDITELAAGVHERLVARDATVAAAESLTGGLLGATLTAPPGASMIFRGAVVAYATDLKERLLGVPGPLLEAEGAVSAQVAGAMAGGVRDRLQATYGVSLTGVAGPDPQDGQSPGTVFVGVAGPDEGQVREVKLSGDRSTIRLSAVRAALELLRDLLDGETRE